jgi:hypothetical protein
MNEVHMFENSEGGSGGVSMAQWNGTTVEQNKAGLNLGDPDINRTGIRSPIALLRVDNTYHGCAQNYILAGDIHEWYCDPRRRYWHFFTEGRNFLVDGMELKIMPGQVEEFEGVISFQEVSCYPEAVIEKQY